MHVGVYKCARRPGGRRKRAGSGGVEELERAELPGSKLHRCNLRVRFRVGGLGVGLRGLGLRG